MQGLGSDSEGGDSLGALPTAARISLRERLSGGRRRSSCSTSTPAASLPRPRPSQPWQTRPASRRALQEVRGLRVRGSGCARSLGGLWRCLQRGSLAACQG